MRVLLINPPILADRKDRSLYSVIDNLFFNSPPLGLAYLAAVLEKQNIPVGIIDAAVERLSIPALIERVKRFEPEIVGLTATTNLFDSAKAAAVGIKTALPHVKLVLGGAHISANPEHAFQDRIFDVGVKGEGEVTFLELIRAFESGADLKNIKGLVLRENDEVIFSPPRELIADLESLPFPARHLLPMDRYVPQPNDQYLLPKMSMIASRGCPYGCIFCDKSIFGQRYRSFSPEYIVSEMEHLITRFKAKDIAFLDSTFTVSQQRVEGIIDEMKKRNVKVHWTCTVRADIVTYELLKKMKNAGCWRIRLGIESGNEEVLRFIRKGITKEQVRNVARWADQLGLQPKGFFMIGHLTDTRRTIEETIRFARSLPLKDITLQANTPMPGTVQYQMSKAYGRLLTDDFSDFSYWEPVFIPKRLSREYLNRAFHRFYRSFYLRPVVFWRHLCSIHSFHNAIKYIKASGLFLSLFFQEKKHSREEAS